MQDTNIAIVIGLLVAVFFVGFMAGSVYHGEDILETDDVPYLGLSIVCNKKTDTCVCFKNDLNSSTGKIETKCP